MNPFLKVSISAGVSISGVTVERACSPIAAPRASRALSSSLRPGVAAGDGLAVAPSFFAWQPDATSAAPRSRTDNVSRFML